MSHRRQKQLDIAISPILPLLMQSMHVVPSAYALGYAMLKTSIWIVVGGYRRVPVERLGWGQQRGRWWTRHGLARRLHGVDAMDWEQTMALTDVVFHGSPK